MYMPISQVTMMAGTAMIQARVCSRRPTSAVSRKPAIGRTSSSGDEELVGGHRRRALLAHAVVLVDERRAAVAVDGDDDGQADGRFGRGDGHDEQRDQRRVSLQRRRERAERDATGSRR